MKIKWDRHSAGWAAGGALYLVGGVILGIVTGSPVTAGIAVALGLLWAYMAYRTARLEARRGADEDR